MKSKQSFQDHQNDTLFNILPVCPRCHHFFDEPVKAFTLHHEWRCWVFTDKKSFTASDGNKYPNPFYKFHYAYPPKIHMRKISRINVDKIKENQENEFENRRGVPAEAYFHELVKILHSQDRWNEDEGVPKPRVLNEKLEFIDLE